MFPSLLKPHFPLKLKQKDWLTECLQLAVIMPNVIMMFCKTNPEASRTFLLAKSLTLQSFFEAMLLLTFLGMS